MPKNTFLNRPKTLKKCPTNIAPGFRTRKPHQEIAWILSWALGYSCIFFVTETHRETMTPALMSPALVKAAAHIAHCPANVPWPALWNSLENFCAMVLYKFVLAAGTTHIPEAQMYAILQEQLALRKQSEFIDLACDLVFVLHGHPSLPVRPGMCWELIFFLKGPENS